MTEKLSNDCIATINMNSDMSKSQPPLNPTLDRPIFFYCCEGVYSPLSICLAEGFKELGIPFYSNINHWKIDPDTEEYLFCDEPSVTHHDCSIVILDFRWMRNATSFPENLFHSERKYVTVFLDDMDGFTIWNPQLEKFDFRLRTHGNSQSIDPSNCLTWVFGLSNRILRETSEFNHFQDRKKCLLVNFRNEHRELSYTKTLIKVLQGYLWVESGVMIVDNPLRQIVGQQFLPLIQHILPQDDTAEDFDKSPSDSYHYLHWKQTGQRHYPSYYQRLKQSTACACFGGAVTSSYFTGEPIVEWWDSWRFWESLAAGCVTFHVDFDKYGVKLPVMPENWRHYVGIDLDNTHDTVARIADDPGILEKISAEGRQWAIKNYSPVPTALRFLEMVGYYTPQKQKEQEKKGEKAIFLDAINLREINLIIFPAWSQPEESLGLELERVVRAIATHPDKSKMTLLIYSSNISNEDANLVLSSVAMNLLMEEDLDVSDGPEISLIGQLSEIQWSVLMPRLNGRIVLENENREASARIAVPNIPSFQLNTFCNKNVVPLESGGWELK
ncbi:hypothetical protein QUA41_15700 [Microcoleus sp. Pol11C1]|uniref:hypothetical protein n=1 Tax=unclassified Microcoleus TaxID=2642155 RepID=UPI002FD727A6